MDMGFGLASMVGAAALFGFLAFVVRIDYSKKKNESDAAHRERMKALELGYPPQDAEIAQARAYASAARAAGLVGLMVPVVVVTLAVIATIVAVLHRAPNENLVPGLSIAWSIAGIIVLVAVLRSLSVIRQLPRPTAEKQPRVPTRDRRPDSASSEIQEKRLEL
jgi:hypothetical protein